MEHIYQDIAARTQGNIYIGVVGPVRTGKSTFIKRVMEEMVIPNIEEPYRRERAKDELPQSGSGKTIMTSEPKFIPEEAVEISPDGTATMRIRMIDSVGYMVDGAVGAEEDGVPRMVATPWYDYEIPMPEAAEIGTRKVMQEHCSIGLVITTDGSITDIPRKDYLDAEGRAITDMKATGKPFLVIINSRNPNSDEALSVQKYIREHFDVEPAVADCQALSGEGINGLLKSLLYAFPMTQLQVHLPRWMDALECSHPIKAALYEALITRVQQIETLAQAAPTLQKLKELENVLDFSVQNVDLATGTVCCTVTFPEKLFYEILSKRTGMDIGSDGELMQILIQLAQIKKEYDKISDAMAQVQATGYGVVMPTAQEMKLEKPELVRKNGSFGVKLKAGAPSIHMIRVDVDTEISPMVGDEKQSKDLVDFLTSEEPEKLWESNIFGKSVGSMIQEGLTSKLLRTPEEVRGRFRGTLSRVVNEGANGLICLIL
ncbi:MAG: stage IV sporulation protein A [Oscillospiraceae bacterium]|nr:stage IV sporulation protein A [Oscillospiraceae bacterium]